MTLSKILLYNISGKIGGNFLEISKEFAKCLKKSHIISTENYYTIVQNWLWWNPKPVESQDCAGKKIFKIRAVPAKNFWNPCRAGKNNLKSAPCREKKLKSVPCRQRTGTRRTLSQTTLNSKKSKNSKKSGTTVRNEQFCNI